MLTTQRLKKMEKTLAQKQPTLELFLDNVESSQNLSAIIRSADGVGVLHLFYSHRGDEDLKIHKTITQGAHRWVERERIASEKKIAFLKEKKQEGFQLVATHLEAKSISFRHVDYSKPTMIVVGNEKEGISSEVLDLADEVIVIPMQGLVQSLNVSVATALILYEAQRQLEEKGCYETPQISLEERKEIQQEWVYRDLIARRSKGVFY